MSDAIEQANSVKEALDRYSGWVAWADELHKTEPKTIAWPYDGMAEDSAKIARAVARDRIGFILSQLPEAKWEEHASKEWWTWKTPVGQYEVRHFNKIGWGWCCGTNDDEPCPSREAGQAQCRADFERRVAEIFHVSKQEAPPCRS